MDDNDLHALPHDIEVLNVIARFAHFRQIQTLWAHHIVADGFRSDRPCGLLGLHSGTDALRKWMKRRSGTLIVLAGSTCDAIEIENEVI